MTDPFFGAALFRRGAAAWWRAPAGGTTRRVRHDARAGCVADGALLSRISFDLPGSQNPSHACMSGA